MSAHWLWGWFAAINSYPRDSSCSWGLVDELAKVIHITVRVGAAQDQSSGWLVPVSGPNAAAPFGGDLALQQEGKLLVSGSSESEMDD